MKPKKPGALDRQNEYLQAISRYPAGKLHFFDESSVIKTTGNHKYGNARVGERAIEVQRYASNATFTINLLHSVVDVDYFNILQGPSNGLELLNFFDNALQVDRADGSAALECGDVVVMDNCSGAPAARRAAQRSPIGITGKKRKPKKDFPYGYHG